MKRIKRFETMALCLLLSILAFVIGLNAGIYIVTDATNTSVSVSKEEAQDITIKAPTKYSFIKKIHYKAYTADLNTYNEITSKGYIEFTGPNEVNVVHLTEIQEE